MIQRLLSKMMEFNDFEELTSYIETLSEETFCIFTKVDCKTVENANKKVAEGQRKYHAKFKYSYVKYACKHFGSARSKSTGIRPNQRTFKTGCPCFMLVSVDRRKDKLVIVKSNLEHNHAISKELFMHYPEKRRLNEDQKKFIGKLRSQRVPPAAICQQLKDVHGKHLTRNDIKNIQTQKKSKKRISRPRDKDTQDSQISSELPPSISIIRGGDTLTSVDSDKHVSQTVSHAVQQLEDELKIARDSISANIKSAESLFPKLFYTTSASDAYQVIESYEMKTNSNFSVCEESEGFGQNEPLHLLACHKEGKDDSKVKHRIMWEDSDTSLAMYERIPFDGAPYMQLGRKIFDCHLEELSEESCKETCKRGRKTVGTSEVDCTARISLREIHKFPEFKMEEGQDSDHNRSRTAKQIRKAIRRGDIIGERRIYVSLPSIADHCGHHVTEVDNFLTDFEVKKKIYELAYQKIFTVEELREKTKEFVEKQVFKRKPLPSLTDRRFYPSDDTFKNICLLARLKMRREGFPVPATPEHGRDNRRPLPQAISVPQVANEVTVVTSAIQALNSPLHSSSPTSHSCRVSERSDESLDFFNMLEEVRSLAQQVEDESLFEELRQTVVNVRKRLKAQCNEDHSRKRRRLQEDYDAADTIAEGEQVVAEICR